MQRMLHSMFGFGGARDVKLVSLIAFIENNKSIGQHFGAKDELIQRIERAFVTRLQKRVSVCGC